MDGWKTFSFPIGARLIFRGENAVSFREGRFFHKVISRLDPRARGVFEAVKNGVFLGPQNDATIEGKIF